MNAIVAAILSFLIPGLGQAISGEVMKGIIFFIIALVIWAIAALIFRNWVVYIIDLLYALYAAYDAYKLNYHDL